MKRHHDEEDGEAPKRPKTGAPSLHQHQNAAVDPTWGQKYVFSNVGEMTTIPLGEESDFEDDADAMAYLLSVRHEATGIPHLLAAPATQIGPQLPPELHGQAPVGIDERGWYEDGAFIARSDSPVEDASTELQDAYCQHVLARYRRLRGVLRTELPANEAKRTSCAFQTTAAPLGPKSSTHRVWSNLLRTTDPHPKQLAVMSKHSVIRILRVLLGGKFLHQGYTLSERTSQWVWGLLARLPEPWELDHSEIGWIRDLGRRAVLLGRSLAEMAALRDEVDLGVHESESEAEDLDEAGEVDDVEGGTGPADDVTAREVERARTTTTTGDESRGDGECRDDDGDARAADADDESVAMELSDGEDALEAAKAAFLSRLEPPDGQEEAKLRLRINMRATLTMILTVAGEFYGQRDLLSFREPFVGM
ncbi:hypothetical protein RJ55_07764 [Drechmeria coniospora]|nr:hypothetical protein RJ55_07764 [Drechmeria coniospora]